MIDVRDLTARYAATKKLAAAARGAIAEAASNLRQCRKVIKEIDKAIADGLKEIENIVAGFDRSEDDEDLSDAEVKAYRAAEQLAARWADLADKFSIDVDDLGGVIEQLDGMT